jgi:sugar/nucleoside kinase (ribokinase family)
MGRARYDVVAIGNAIVDIIGRCDEVFLARHDAPKGHMRLVDAATIERLYAAMGPATEVSGGSAANTMVGVASLGGLAGFIGKVAGDELGRIFAHDIRAAGVTFASQPETDGPPTSRSLILVTPDGERTMNTFLGISTAMEGKLLDRTLIGDAAVLYLEGYLFDLPEAKAAFHSSVAMAKAAGRQVALSLSDSFCVDRHRADFLDLIRGGVDVLFANEGEIKSLYETPSFDDAARRAGADVKLAALTWGAKGARMVAGGQAIEVPAEPVKAVIDTTGAGDLFAAGFLFGHARGMPLSICGRLGCLAAAEIISHIGARPETSLATLARERGLLA